MKERREEFEEAIRTGNWEEIPPLPLAFHLQKFPHRMSYNERLQ